MKGGYTMDFWGQVMDLINKGMFPIACVIALVYVIVIMFKAYREDNKSTTDAINNNTVALNRLIDKMDKD
jgi:hypothetical protein